MTTTKPTLAFFGATGGCILACLAPALEAGYDCIALARTPSKLHSMLTTRGLPASTIAAHLTIIQGSSTDLQAVKTTLANAQIIISGIGGAMSFSNPLHPTLDNPTICQDTMRTILAALHELFLTPASSPGAAGNGSRGKPLLIALSTTGISAKRDVPFAMLPMYHWMLRQPHADKKVMEELVQGEMARPEPERALKDFVLIRPSFLTDCKPQREKLRVGKGSEAPVGYIVPREAVGGFVFEVVQAQQGGFWGGIVTLSY